MFRPKIKTYLSAKRVRAFLGLVFLILLGFVRPLSAQNVIQGYGSDTNLQTGTVVSIRGDDATKVEPADKDNQKRLLGIVVDANDAPVTLSADQQKFFVATVGRYLTLVSDQNGKISPGDFLTVSSIKGVATKVNDSDSLVVGRAVDTFDSKSSTAVGSTTIKSGDGKTQEIVYGRITVDIGVSSNPLFKGQGDNLPGVLSRATEAIAGKPVSTVKAYLSLIVFMAASIITGAMLYAGIRSSISAVGRNPLSRKTIFRGLIQVILSALIIFISGMIGVYLLLKL